MNRARAAVRQAQRISRGTKGEPRPWARPISGTRMPAATTVLERVDQYREMSEHFGIPERQRDQRRRVCMVHKRPFAQNPNRVGVCPVCYAAATR